MRDQVLLALRTPILFVQGTRDPLCPLDKLAAVRNAMTCDRDLHVVESGDHSLKITAALLVVPVIATVRFWINAWKLSALSR